MGKDIPLSTALGEGETHSSSEDKCVSAKKVSIFQHRGKVHQHSSQMVGELLQRTLLATTTITLSLADW